MFACTLSLSSDFRAFVLTVTQLSVKTSSTASHASAQMMLNLLSLAFSKLLHRGSSKLFPNFTMASLLHCFTWAKPILSTAREGWSQLPPAPGPCSSRCSQQPQFDTLVFLPSAVFFTVTVPQVHNSSLCFSTSGSYLNLCFCSCPS